MWIALIDRFTAFNSSLQLTPDQLSDGETKHAGVRRCLNNWYYSVNSETANSFLIGSWAKGTRVRPPRDVDLYFEIPYADYLRFEAHVGNKQSALLQEIKGVLQATYSTSDMSGDGQVVVVRFNTISVEVVPVVRLNNGQFFVPHTHDGGKYVTSDPVAEATRIETSDAENNGNVRRMVQMLKAWQYNCNVSLKSFYLELLVADFLDQSPWRHCGYFYYDWLIRDFFAYVLLKYAHDAAYIMKEHGDGPVGEEYKRHAKALNSKPFVAPCHSCRDTATRATAYRGDSGLMFWCDDCDPYSSGAVAGKLVIIRTFGEAISHVAYSGARTDQQDIIRSLAEAKGCPKRLTQVAAVNFLK